MFAKSFLFYLFINLSFSLLELIIRFHGFRSKNDSQTTASSTAKSLICPETLEIEKAYQNPLFPATHSVVKFHYQPDRGRFAVADQDIEASNISLFKMI